MPQNAYFLAKIGADTAENEQHLAEILLKTGDYLTGPLTGAGATARVEAVLQLSAANASPTTALLVACMDRLRFNRAHRENETSISYRVPCRSSSFCDQRCDLLSSRKRAQNILPREWTLPDNE